MSRPPRTPDSEDSLCGRTGSSRRRTPRGSLRAALHDYGVDKTHPDWKRHFLQRVAACAATPDDMYETLQILDHLAHDSDVSRRLLGVQVVYAALTWGLSDDVALNHLLEVVHLLMHDSEVEVRALTVPLLAVLLGCTNPQKRRRRNPAVDDDVFYYVSEAKLRKEAGVAVQFAEARVWRFVYDAMQDDDDVVVKIALATLFFIVPKAPAEQLSRVHEQFHAAMNSGWPAAQDYTPSKLLVNATWLCARCLYDGERHWFVDPAVIERDFHNSVPGRVRRWWRRRIRRSPTAEHAPDEYTGRGIGDWYTKCLRAMDRWMSTTEKQQIRQALRDVRKRVIELSAANSREMWDERWDGGAEVTGWYAEAALFGTVFEAGINAVASGTRPNAGTYSGDVEEERGEVADAAQHET